MKRAYSVNIYRTIISSIGRYMAILSIIALGVGFFTGLKSTKPAMMLTAEKYIDDTNLFDYRVISTIGINSEEVSKINELEYVNYAEGSVYKDFIMESEDVDNSVVMRAHSLPQIINGVDVVEGRMPETNNECVVDYRAFSKEDIGDKIVISSENEEETLDYFAYDEYEIVGIAKSACYMNMERGTTSLGNGLLSGYMYIPEESFDFEYYSECYVVLNGDESEFSKEYENKLEDNTDIITKDCENIINDRYDELLQDAKEELEDAKKELNEAKADTEVQLEDARRELDEGWDKLLSGKKEIEDSKKKLEEGKKELKQAEDEIKENTKLLADSKVELEEGTKKIEEGEKELEEGVQKLVDEEIKLNEAGDLLADTETQIDASRFELELAKVEIEKNKEELEKLKEISASGDTQYDEIIAIMESEIAKAEEEYNKGYAEFCVAEATFNKKNEEYLAGKKQYEAAVIEIDNSKIKLQESKKELDAGWASYNDGLAKLEQGKKELESAKLEISNGEKELADGIKEIEENEKKLNEGEEEYKDGLKEYEEEIADAEEKIKDGEEELADIENPEYFILDRNTNVGFACFENDADIVDGVAKVFPVFFFLIAALVCSTTMTRMVDDERTQIGTYRALGYSNFKIMMKYIIYSGSASIIGCLIGFYLGSYVFPRAIWAGYGMLYGFAEIEFVTLPYLLIIDMIVSLLCSVGTTVITCRTELFNMPAELIRRKAPSAGKRILLERISFIWNRMKFLHKVTARNIFRFKKRMIMMILGIAGCCALVLAGFGIDNSISNIINVQYGEIMLMDANLMFSDGISDETIKYIEEDFSEEIADYALVDQISLDAHTEGGLKSVYLVASADDNTSDFVNLHMGDTKVKYPAKGEAAISEKIAELMNVTIGDEVSFTYDDSKTVKFVISDIFENYVNHYLFISDETYEEAFEEEFVPQIMYVNFVKGQDEYKVAAELSELEDVTSITVTSEMMKRIESSMESMNYIVGLVIVCAGALAFVVLFNLSNINISERVREIATIEVLGFYSNETRSYVFRENFVLTLMGIVAGLPLGVWLHSFIMSKINIDMVSFQTTILPMSYLYAVVIVIGFTFFVDFVMRGKIAKINMAEALKSMD